MNKILIILGFILLFVIFYYLCVFIDKSLRLSIYMKKDKYEEQILFIFSFKFYITFYSTYLTGR